MKPVIVETVPKKVTVKLDSTPLLLPKKIQEQHQKFWEERTEQNPIYVTEKFLRLRK
ncbi:hypothetical protein [Psychrobacillus sp.]|uniref:hypothetical protein n=1 Tax=Psychrobacillus sp. TaxID=1871623 RepID=UPI0028BDDFB8|nr:hypothetical protein [Psychrobacillus sp.]